MIVTASLMLIVLRDEQFLKVLSGMVVMPLPSVAVTREEQFVKTPMSEVEIVVDVSPQLFQCPRAVTLLGTFTVVSLE